MAQRALHVFTLAAMLAAAGLVVQVPQASGAVVSFDPLHSSVAVGDTVTVQVTVDAGAPDLRGMSMVLEFDPSIVEPIVVGPGSLVSAAACSSFFSWLNSPAVGDSVSVDLALLGCSVAGPGNVVEARFVALHEGYSELVWRSLILRDSVNASIPATCVNGSITVGPISLDARTWGRVKSAYRRSRDPR